VLLAHGTLPNQPTKHFVVQWNQNPTYNQSVEIERFLVFWGGLSHKNLMVVGWILTANQSSSCYFLSEILPAGYQKVSTIEIAT